MPEPDKQVRGYADQFPKGVKLDDVGRQHQSEHRGGKESHISVVAGRAAVVAHIAQGINLHQQADAADYYQHNAGQRVEEQAHLNGGAAQIQPGMGGKVRDAAAAVQQEQQPEGKDERDRQGGNQYPPAQRQGVAVQEGPNH